MLVYRLERPMQTLNQVVAHDTTTGYVTLLSKKIDFVFLHGE